MTPMVLERFFSKIDTPDGERGCWLWNGAVGSDGYGRIRRKGTTHSAHRYAYFLFKGEVPEGLCVLHACDEPRCVNPTHLFVGTKKDNSRDMLAKGRHTTPLPHLKRKDVDEIRKRLRTGESKTAIAEEFGICRSTVQDIERGATWNREENPRQLRLFG